MNAERLTRGIAVLTLASVSWLAGPVRAQQPEEPAALTARLSSARAAERIEAAAKLAEVADLAARGDLFQAAVAAMKDPVEEVRYLAVSAVGANAYAGAAGTVAALKPAVPGLVQCLDDPSERVRAAAADALALIGTPPRATADLLGLVDHDPSPTVRRAAVGALARLPVAEGAVRDALLVALRDDADATVRGEAAKALAAHRFDDDQVIGALRRALDDPEEYVQQNAVRALGLLGDRAAAAVPDLEALAARTDRDSVRRQVGYALRSIQGVAAASTGPEPAGPQARTEATETEQRPAGSPPPPR